MIGRPRKYAYRGPVTYYDEREHVSTKVALTAEQHHAVGLVAEKYAMTRDEATRLLLHKALTEEMN